MKSKQLDGLRLHSPNDLAGIVSALNDSGSHTILTDLATAGGIPYSTFFFWLRSPDSPPIGRWNEFRRVVIRYAGKRGVKVA